MSSSVLSGDDTMPMIMAAYSCPIANYSFLGFRDVDDVNFSIME